ncbi:hypothetical protein LRAMOSA03075 [Lichtheimia ramosa]|uniref:Aldose 1-epimerase n=1 Tax=Lichtheimia ramosa TaxID=688394 RepID=A0A077WT20_9FUNG|nr:hypothetical protein LRAMOSA03075 [Lichtheimia ramosa]
MQIVSSLILAAGLLMANVNACEEYKKHTIKAKGIEASFIEYGATITNLWVNDKHGVPRDIILGWDDTSQYNLQSGLPGFLGGVVGRYANRIANGTFTIDDTEYHTPLNENKITTLHGGDMGFNRLNWTLIDKGKQDITFGLTSADGDEGFPGTVDVRVKYSVNDNQEWHIDYEGTTDKETIMMLSQHTYWNLDAFTTSDTVDDQVLWIPADKFIKTDGALIPTGELADVEGTALDFRKEKPIGRDLKKATECGDDCIGYDNCFVLSDPNEQDYQLKAYAPSTGIQLAIKTDQPAMQFYSCNGLDGTLPIKKTQGPHGSKKHAHHRKGGKKQYVQQYGCFVLETEEYIDGINNPQWGKEHMGLLKPDDKYTQHAEYHFSIHH